jgi:O-antigen/teichoic acid export membrane protein
VKVRKRQPRVPVSVPAVSVAPGARATRTMTLFGEVAMRDAAIFGLGMAAIVPLGIVSVAVTTRYLPPAVFGHLAILFAIASTLTVVSAIGFTTGTMLATYGSEGDEDDGVEVDAAPVAVPGESVAATVAERRRLYTSGVLIVTLVSGVVCGAVGLLAPVIAELVVGGSEWTEATRWMAASAWTGTIWRTVHQIYRLERRPVAWSLVNSTRPILVVAATVAILASGGGVAGVLMATAAGTVGAIAIAILAAPSCYRLEPRRGDAAIIWSYGVRWIPLHLARATQANVSILLLGLLAPAAAVGFFQVANRIAQVPTFFGEGYVFAWVPLERAPIANAAKEHKGERPFEAQVFLLLILCTLGLLVVVTLSADALVRIAPPAYRDAAPLIPLLAAAQALDLVFRGIYRATGFHNRRYWFTILQLVWILPYAGVAVLAVNISPLYGVIAAQVVAWALVCVWMLRLDAGGGSPTPFPWSRMAAATAIAAACVVVVGQLPDDPALHFFAATAAMVACPLLMRATGVITPYHVTIVRTLVRSLLPRRLSRAEARRRLESMPDREREVLVALGFERHSAEMAAERLGASPNLVCARLVRGLRRFAGSPVALPDDAYIGRYLVNGGTTLERDLVAGRLREQGIDFLELHHLDETMKLFRRLRRQRAFAPTT